MPEETSFVDYYALLGVPTTADAASIRRVFILKAKQFHPDVGGSTESMQQYTKAYRTLVDESSRRAYDLMHSFHTGNSDTQYRHDDSPKPSSEGTDFTDDEIDAFLDQIYAEYRTKPKTKKSFIDKIKDVL